MAAAAAVAVLVPVVAGNYAGSTNRTEASVVALLSCSRNRHPRFRCRHHVCRSFSVGKSRPQHATAHGLYILLQGGLGLAWTVLPARLLGGCFAGEPVLNCTIPSLVFVKASSCRKEASRS